MFFILIMLKKQYNLLFRLFLLLLSSSVSLYEALKQNESFLCYLGVPHPLFASKSPAKLAAWTANFGERKMKGFAHGPTRLQDYKQSFKLEKS